MPSLLTLVVAYAGIGGPSASKVDAQVHAMLAKSGDVIDMSLKSAERHALVTHSAKAKAIVTRIDSPSLVAGEIDKKGKKLTVVVYGEDGSLVDFVEVDVRKHKLAKSDLDNLRSTLVPDIERLESQPKEDAEPVAQADDDENPAPAADKPSKETASAADDDDAPAGLAVADTATTTGTVSSAPHHAPRVEISVGAGPIERTFEPGPSMVEGYRSSPVPVGQVDLRFAPVKYVAVEAGVDRTLTMSSALDSGNASTAILRWQADAALRLPLGPIELAALGGIGDREFVIGAPAPTPDGHYVYAIAGGQLTIHAGRVEIRGRAAYEPVVGGPQNIQMASGPATRNAIEFGGAIEVAASQHIVVTAAGGYQRFTWKWTEGTATDAYPSATLSVGARY